MKNLAIACCTALVVLQQLTAAQSPADEESYAVYGSALVSIERELPEVALLSETRADNNCDTHVPSGWEDVAADFYRVNAQPRTLLDGVNLGRAYRLVTGQELETASRISHEQVEQQLQDRDPTLPSPFAQYPGPKVLIFSAVGFSVDRARAMFMLQHRCGFECTGGDQFLLVKVDGRWIDAKEIATRCRWMA